MNMQVMLCIELYGSINYDPCLGSSVRFSAASSVSGPGLTAGHTITPDSVSPICVTGTKTYDSLPPCLKSLISPPRGGDGSLGPERGSRGSWSDVSGMRVMSDIRMTGWWHMVTAPPQLIGTPRRSPQAAVVGSLATGGGAGHPCAQDHIPSELEMVPGSASFILLSPTPVIPGVIQLVHNHNESHSPTTGLGGEGNSLCQQWNNI